MRHVPHVFVPQPWQGQAVDLDDATLHHLRSVLRLLDGAAVSYTDGEGKRGQGVLEAGRLIRGTEVRVSPPRPCLTLAVAPPRSVDRARFLVEKLAELGVDRLVWLRTSHTIGRPPKPVKARAWAREALEQSRGAWLMDIDETQRSIGELKGTVLTADPEGEPAFPIDGDTTLLVGPEGGLTPDETRGVAISLGSRILRVETAAIAGAVLLRKTTQRGDNRGESG
jgi:16S rRNA (uracil1498-N3)-methyltransferase